jgi:protein phosphatase-4 regulatory subunit 3
VALTIVTQSQAQLSLQQHLDIAPDILNCSEEELEGELQPLIMAQAVPNPPNDKKRVKVYELRNNDWFDRGTGFCTAAFIFVCASSSCFTRLSHLAPTPLSGGPQVNVRLADLPRF